MSEPPAAEPEQRLVDGPARAIREQPKRMKASIQVLGEHGYVWDADVAHWLRLECGIIGAAVGGVAAFKQQNAVHGLPLELSPEEVTLALERGWGELQPALRTAEAAAAAAAAAGAAGKRGGRQPSSAYHYYEEEEEGYENYYGDDGASGEAEPMDAEDGAGGHRAAAEPAVVAEPTWRAALADGASFDIPITPRQAAASNAGGQAAGAAEAAAAAAAAAGEASAAAAGEEAAGEAGKEAGLVVWTFPATQEERHRYWVFRDLHSKGYRLTGGSKFGADYLIYPGDPTLYHAQFCVRLLPFRRAILPAMLASATRGSHQARKHLLIASVVEQEEVAEQEGVVVEREGTVQQHLMVEPEPLVGEQQQSVAEQEQMLVELPLQPVGAAGEQQPAGAAGDTADAVAGQAAQGALGNSSDGRAVSSGAAPGAGEGTCRQQLPQQQGQHQEQRQLVETPGNGSVPRIGADSRGTGSLGERYRIHYMTIGPVEGFG